MATIVQHKAGHGATGATVSINFTSSVSTGNLVVIVLALASNASTPVVSFTDDKGNTYVLATDHVFQTLWRVAIYYAVNVTGGDGLNIQCVPDSHTSIEACAYEVSGIATSSPVNGTSAGNDGVFGSVTITNFTAANSGAFFAVYMEPTTLPAGTFSGGWTIDLTELNAEGIMSMSQVGPAATYGGTLSQNAGDYWGTTAAGFKDGGPAPITGTLGAAAQNGAFGLGGTNNPQQQVTGTLGMQAAPAKIGLRSGSAGVLSDLEESLGLFAA